MNVRLWDCHPPIERVNHCARLGAGNRAVRRGPLGRRDEFHGRIDVAFTKEENALTGSGASNYCASLNT
jgi:hypothetical protein